MLAYVDKDSVNLVDVNGENKHTLNVRVRKYRSVFDFVLGNEMEKIRIMEVKFSNSGQLLAVRFYNGGGGLFDVPRNDWSFVNYNLMDRQHISSMTFSPDDELIAFGAQDRVCCCSRLGQIEHEVEGLSIVNDLEFTRDGLHLVVQVSHIWDVRILVYETTTWTRVVENVGLSHIITFRLLMNDTAVLTLHKYRLYLWAFEPRQELTQPVFEFECDLNYTFSDSLGVTADELCVVAFRDKHVLVWSVHDGSLIRSLNVFVESRFAICGNKIVVYHSHRASIVFSIEGVRVRPQTVLVLDTNSGELTGFDSDTWIMTMDAEPANVVLM
jgi:WD40 repeat protein